MLLLFWALLGLILYSLAGYGLLVIGLARLRGAPAAPPPGPPLDAVLLIAAHNEEADIGAKLENALSLDMGPHRLEIVVACDGCTDRSAEIVRGYGARGVRLVEIVPHRGKRFAIDAALEQIDCDVVVFSDANSLFEPQSLAVLLRHFADASVGGVCGNLVVPERRRGWLGRCEAIYWRYDHALKTAESRLGGAVSAQGSLYAVRRELLAPLPEASADDLVTSLRVVAAGQRLVFEPLAVTREAVSDSGTGEFRRRVRSTERGWRGLMLYRELLDPQRSGAYALRLFSHKVLRRLIPFLLVALALVNLRVLAEGAFYVATALAQALVYGAALLGWLSPRLRGSACFSVPLFFVMGQVAMALGVLNVLRGRRSDRWQPVRPVETGGAGR